MLKKHKEEYVGKQKLKFELEMGKKFGNIENN
jgi:hypothetical protein